MPDKQHGERSRPASPKRAPKSALRSADRLKPEAGPKVSAGFKASGAGGGVFGIDNLFTWLGNVVEQLGEVAEKADQGGFQKQGEFKVEGLGDKARGVYGVSVKMGHGGKPAFRSFGNIHRTPKGPEVSDVREPLIDVFDEEGEVLVVAELPGASEQEIDVKVKDGLLTLEAKGDHRYAKDVELPAPVKPDPLRKVYRNGLLEIRFAKI
jgi:HSP20 family protein